MSLQDKEFVGDKIRKTGHTLKFKDRPLMSWTKYQWNETRRKTSVALFRCTQCTDAYLDEKLLHSRTHFQCCYKIPRCASMAAFPTISDVKAFSKLARQIKPQPVKLQYWPLNGPLRTLGFFMSPSETAMMALHREA